MISSVSPGSQFEGISSTTKSSATTTSTNNNIASSTISTNTDNASINHHAAVEAINPHGETTLKVTVTNCCHPVNDELLVEIFRKEVAVPTAVECDPWRQTTNGFVTFVDAVAAARALQHMDGKQLYPDGCLMSIKFKGVPVEPTGESFPQREDNHLVERRRKNKFPSLPPHYFFQRCLSEEVRCMSVVVEAVDQRKNKRVVLKRATSKKNERYIRRELRILKQCEAHPHVVQLAERELVDGWLVVEHMGGGSFDSECEVPRNLTHREVLEIAVATSKALAFLHSKGIIHRDVKPHNIFFEKDYVSGTSTVKLADMGLAIQNQDITSSPLMAKFAGTKRYAACETLSNKTSPASDMWSWACTIAHLATGVKPYEGDDNSLPYSTELRDAELPHDLHELLTSCLAQEVLQRPKAEEAVLHCQQALETLSCVESAQKLSFAPQEFAPTEHLPGKTETPDFSSANHIDRAAALANNQNNQNNTAQSPSPTLSNFPRDDSLQHSSEWTSHSDEEHKNSSTESGDDENDVIELRHSDAKTFFTPDSNPLRDSSLETLMSLMEKDTDVDAADKNGYTALMHASCDGQIEKLRALLFFGASVDATNDAGETSLMCSRRSEVTRTLLEAGAAADKRNRHTGQTAMMVACRDGLTAVVQILLEHGASADVSDRHGCTALMFSWNDNATKLLLEHGVSVDVADKEGNTALMHASSNGQTAKMRMLLHFGASVDAANNEGETSLMRTQNIKVAKILLDGGAAINAKTKQGCTPLMLASSSGSCTVPILLAHGAAIDERDNTGSTALLKSVHNKHDDISKMLLNNGASIDTGLLEACKTGSLSIVACILEHGANTEIVDGDGLSALMHASKKGHTEMVKSLLEGGCNVQVGEHEGYTALMYAGEIGHAQVVRAILSHTSTSRL